MEEAAAPRRYPADQLEAFVASVFAEVGVPPDDARSVAELMVRADLSGSEGHGIFRLPHYVRRIRAGGINVRPQIRIEREKAATALINGDNGIGHLVVRRAAEIAIEKAEHCGVSWVGINHGNHAGPAFLYASMPLEKDMVGLYSAVGSANHLPPWGGTEMLLSTNPIAAAIPAYEEPPLVMDMATTVAAYGKVKTAAQRGETMPEGWMIDKEGNPLTDPTRAAEGFLLPIGGYKGYALALVLGLLAGTLNSAALGRDVIDFNADDTTTTNTGQFVVAISIEAFCEVEDFKKQVDQVIREMRSSPRLPGVERIRVPGERSHEIRLERSRSGIPIHDVLKRGLDALAADLGIPGLPA
jgi:L-2-hydroxycarboxylate dehydrogenase (NAD+)